MASKNEAARGLAAAHYRCEPGVSRIFRIIAEPQVEIQPGEPIKLLEVNENTVPAGILPIQFGPHPESGVAFPSVIVEVTAEEYDRIVSGELRLPQGWSVGELLPAPSHVESANT